MLKKKIYKLKYFFLTLILVIIYLNETYKPIKIQTDNNLIINKEHQSCNVFTKKLNEKYNIDNKWYPSFLPSIHNKSLDLKCLNSKSVKTKTILLFYKMNKCK